MGRAKKDTRTHTYTLRGWSARTRSRGRGACAGPRPPRDWPASWKGEKKGHTSSFRGRGSSFLFVCAVSRTAAGETDLVGNCRPGSWRAAMADDGPARVPPFHLASALAPHDGPQAQVGPHLHPPVQQPSPPAQQAFLEHSQLSHAQDSPHDLQQHLHASKDAAPHLQDGTQPQSAGMVVRGGWEGRERWLEEREGCVCLCMERAHQCVCEHASGCASGRGARCPGRWPAAEREGKRGKRVVEDASRLTRRRRLSLSLSLHKRGISLPRVRPPSRQTSPLNIAQA